MMWGGSTVQLMWWEEQREKGKKKRYTVGRSKQIN